MCVRQGARIRYGGEGFRLDRLVNEQQAERVHPTTDQIINICVSNEFVVCGCLRTLTRTSGRYVRSGPSRPGPLSPTTDQVASPVLWMTHRQAAPDELEQRLRRLVAGLAQVGVDRAVVLALGRVGSCRDARLLQRLDEPLGLGGRLGVIGDVQDQERRDALVPGDVGDG